MAENAKLKEFIDRALKYKGPAYSLGGGHPYGKPGQAVDCSGLFNSVLKEMGINFTGNTTSYAEYVLEKERFNVNKKYPPGTVIINPPAGASGHMAMVIADDQTLLQSSYPSGVNTSYKMPDFYAHFKPTVAGVLPGIGSGETGPISGAESNAGGSSGGGGSLLEDVAAGVGQGIVRAIKFVYAYSVLRPLDFWGGFSYELAIAVSRDFDPTEEAEDEGATEPGGN